jgi:hypothetical protein
MRAQEKHKILLSQNIKLHLTDRFADLFADLPADLRADQTLRVRGW